MNIKSTASDLVHAKGDNGFPACGGRFNPAKLEDTDAPITCQRAACAEDAGDAAGELGEVEVRLSYGGETITIPVEGATSNEDAAAIALDALGVEVSSRTTVKIR